MAYATPAPPATPAPGPPEAGRDGARLPEWPDQFPRIPVCEITRKIKHASERNPGEIGRKITEILLRTRKKSPF
ncbi:hypothetical protein Smic_14320 [Streptomyces microflavus]|uniref:Uncharacterized protein n=1 Tax=Streptomyces microflavus TaxID=1919 RepID=A0A7J0CK66_STRMI|nr:hypothetical protein Smic_14320 [Streptomyces microflavus]